MSGDVQDERFRELADFAPVGIAVVDADGSVRYVNGRLAEITHRSPESLLGQDLESFLVPARVIEVVQRGLAGETGAVAIVDDATDRQASSLTRIAAGLAHEFATLTGPPPGPPASFVVDDVIRAAVAPVAEHVSLSLRLAEPPASVHMDRTRFAEALRQLAVNAVEAMPGGGELTVVASRAKNRPEFVHISFVDNGCGMVAETLDHATEPFFTTKAGAPSAGLGLATARGIVKRAGGELSIASKPGAGTTVHMYVPSAPDSPPDEGGDSRGTLLIVDDNDDLRLLATRLLTRAGFEVLAAPGGVEAMAILRDRPFDCLVTDIAMPEMGGIDLAENASAIDPEMPIVFVSGFVNIPQGPCGPLPVNAHSISKPYTPEALTAAVRRAIRARLRATT